MKLNDKNKNLKNSPAKNDKKNNLPEFLLYPDNGDLHYYYKFNKKMIMDTADISNLKHQIETERAQALNIKPSHDAVKVNINHLPCLKMNAIADSEDIEDEYDNYSSIGDLVRTTRNRVKEKMNV